MTKNDSFIGRENEVKRSHQFPLHGIHESRTCYSALRVPLPLPGTKSMGERNCFKIELARRLQRQGIPQEDR